MARWTVVLCAGGSLAVALACGTDAPTTPPPTATPPPPTASFALVSSSQPFGSTLMGKESDLQGISDLELTVQWTYPTSMSDVYFVLELLSGSTECIRSQIAYSTRLDGGPHRSYEAGALATYRASFFVRDNQQPSCGTRFSTDQVRFVLQDRSSGSPRTVYTKDVPGGWNFAFAR